MKYNHANSQSAAPAKPFNWCPATVSDILSKQEYCGDTVNFHSTTKSFKNKTKIDLPKEDWKVFPDTHPAIIGREDFALVQELRSHRRRPAKTGIVSMFSGLLYCADCGHKLYYSATGNYKREQANFFCSTYRKDSEQCSSHFIREKIGGCENTASLEQFIAKVRAVTRPTELIHEFIEKIIVSEARYIDNKRYQIVDIYYKGVGMIKGLSPEEMEEAFREGERRRGYEKADAANTASAE